MILFFKYLLTSFFTLVGSFGCCIHDLTWEVCLCYHLQSFFLCFLQLNHRVFSPILLKARALFIFVALEISMMPLQNSLKEFLFDLLFALCEYSNNLWNFSILKLLLVFMRKLLSFSFYQRTLRD